MAIGLLHITLVGRSLTHSSDFTSIVDDRDQLDSLGKLRRPSVKSDSSLPWTSHNPKATLQAWALPDSRNGKLSSSPTSGRPTSANTVTADSDTGKEDGELPSTGATDMDVTMNSSKPEADTPEIRKDSAGGAESMGIDGMGQGNIPSPDGSSKMSVPADALSDEGEIRQQDAEMGEATGHSTGEDHIVQLPALPGINVPGPRSFRAVLRRENAGSSGKQRVELEVQVSI